MDTSEEYMKMCACDEIQGQWRLHTHDFVVRKEYPYKAIRATRIRNRAWSIWLPRQDQIQEMMDRKGCKFEFTHYTNKICGHFTDKGKHLFGLHCNSMEQLWLAFYIWEKHQKFWGKDGWQK